jgi:hypothetical protein
VISILPDSNDTDNIDESKYGFTIETQIKPDRSYILNNEPAIVLCDIDSDNLDEIITMGEAVGYYDYQNGKYNWIQLLDNLSGYGTSQSLSSRGDGPSEALAIDLTGDGKNEFIFYGMMDSEQGLYIFAFNNGSLQLVDQYETEDYRWMGIFDIDDDDILELVGLSKENYYSIKLYIIDEIGYGSIQISMKVPTWDHYCLADLDGDLKLELTHISGGYPSNLEIEIYNIFHNGTLEKEFTREFQWTPNPDYFAIDEIDNIPGEEIVIASYTSAIICVGYKNGNYIFKWEIEGDMKSRGDIEIADVDNDGVKEIVIANSNLVGIPSIETLEINNGNISSGEKTPYYQYHFDAIEVGDVNGDGKNEIVALRSGIVELDIITTTTKTSNEILKIDNLNFYIIVIVLLLIDLMIMKALIHKLKKYDENN